MYFGAKAPPSRAHGAAIIHRFELDRLSVRFALIHPLLMPHAGPRLGGSPGPAYYRLDKLGSLARP